MVCWWSLRRCTDAGCEDPLYFDDPLRLADFIYQSLRWHGVKIRKIIVEVIEDYAETG